MWLRLDPGKCCTRRKWSIFKNVNFRNITIIASTPLQDIKTLRVFSVRGLSCVSLTLETLSLKTGIPNSPTNHELIRQRYLILPGTEVVA